MNRHNVPPAIALPDDLDDAAAVTLHTFFLEAAHLIEQHYAGQLLRYRYRPHPGQQDLWDQDPPF